MRSCSVAGLLVALTIVMAPAMMVAARSPARTSFELYDLSDKLFSLDKVRSEPGTSVVVVDFFSMACAPCKRAMPRLSELGRVYQAAGLKVVVVAVPAGGDRGAELERIRGFFEPISPSFPVVFDKYSVVARQYGLISNGSASLPRSFIIDSSGGMVAEFEDMEGLAAAIERRFGGDGAGGR
ncbi:MAG TPA: TlpA disulfide reductase family protein [Myxococcota bacterium]|nr:TlpA disulfide reductase family protein [Myxococcota bacterium]